MSEGGHASSWAARFHGKVGTGAVVYSGLGVNFVDPKGQYDASKYAGVSFWARRAENSTGKVRLKVPDVNTDKEAGVCTECFNDFGADFTFTTEWKQYVVPFKSMRQLGGWGRAAQAAHRGRQGLRPAMAGAGPPAPTTTSTSTT